MKKSKIINPQAPGIIDSTGAAKGNINKDFMRRVMGNGMPPRPETTPEEIMMRVGELGLDALISEPTAEELRVDLNAWLADDSITDPYAKVNIVKKGEAIIRMYRYSEEETSEGLLLGTKKYKILNIGKIMALHLDDQLEGWSIGDNVYLPAGLMNVHTNPEWVVWNRAQQVERPAPNVPEPEKLVGMILDWRKTQKFVLDPVEPTEDDDFTFYVKLGGVIAKPE